MFEISASEFGTVGMRRRFRACEFLTMVTKGCGPRGVHKVVIGSSFSVIR